MNVFSTAHARGQNSFHFVWKPKYAYHILVGDVKSECVNVLREIAKKYGFVIHSLEVLSNHIHVFLSFKPSVCVSDVFHKLKGVSARRLFQRFPELRRRYWGGHLWSRGKFFRSVGSTTDKAVKHYIECSQHGWHKTSREIEDLDSRQTRIIQYA